HPAPRPPPLNGPLRGHAIIGYISAPHLGGPLLTTASIGFSGSWYDSMNLQHRVQAPGTLNMNWSQATTWGTLNEASENSGLALLLEGPWHNEPPSLVSGNFV